MRLLYFVTHADVVIDGDVAVTEWRLSDRGRARHDAFSRRCPPVAAVYCSTERKAHEGAMILAQAQGLCVQPVSDLHENDRSATGYLPGPEFETTADAFFAQPHRSVRGWERAADAQTRVVSRLRQLAAKTASGDIAVVAHGGIGALFRAHLLGAAIDRSHDQPRGIGGHVLVAALPDWRLARDWSVIERFSGEP